MNTTVMNTTHKIIQPQSNVDLNSMMRRSLRPHNTIQINQSKTGIKMIWMNDVNHFRFNLLLWRRQPNQGMYELEAIKQLFVNQQTVT